MKSVSSEVVWNKRKEVGQAHEGVVCAKVQHIPNMKPLGLEPHAGACDGESARH